MRWPEPEVARALGGQSLLDPGPRSVWLARVALGPRAYRAYRAYRPRIPKVEGTPPKGPPGVGNPALRLESILRQVVFWILIFFDWLVFIAIGWF